MENRLIAVPETLAKILDDVRFVNAPLNNTKQLNINGTEYKFIGILTNVELYGEKKDIEIYY